MIQTPDHSVHSLVTTPAMLYPLLRFVMCKPKFSGLTAWSMIYCSCRLNVFVLRVICECCSPVKWHSLRNREFPSGFLSWWCSGYNVNLWMIFMFQNGPKLGWGFCTPSPTDVNVENVHQVIHKDRHVLLAVFVTF